MEKYISENPALIAKLLAESKIEVKLPEDNSRSDIADPGPARVEIEEADQRSEANNKPNETITSEKETENTRQDFTADELLSKRKAKSKASKAQQAFSVSKHKITSLKLST